MFGTHRASFSPPDLCRWYISGKLGRADSEGLEAFARQFASTALLVELGDAASLDRDVVDLWCESNIGLAVDRPTVIYGNGGSRISFELAVAAMNGRARTARRFSIAFCDNEREAVQALIQLRTARARDSMIPPR
jgi:hypothetical protein